MFRSNLSLVRSQRVSTPTRLLSAKAECSLSRVATSERVADALKIAQEWEGAKPFEEIPGDSKFGLVRGFLPRGKYHGCGFYEYVKRSREQFGDVFKVKGLFGKRDILFTFDPEDIEKVYRTEGTWPSRRGMNVLGDYRDRIRADFFKGAKGLLTTQGEEWGNFRSAINPILMNPNSVKLYIEKIEEVQTDFMKRIRDTRDPVTKEVPGTFMEDINRWTFESVVAVAVNKRLGLLSSNSDDADVKLLFDSLKRFFGLVFEIEMQPSIWRYYETKKYKELIKLLDNITDMTFKFVNAALEKIEKSPSPDDEKSLFSYMLKVDKKIATVMAMDMMFAGVETTSTIFAGQLMAIATNPEKQDKLRQELKKVLPNKESTLTVETLKNLPYLRACIKEGLRMYPLSIGNMRGTGENIVLGGYQVPKGTDVMFGMEFLMRQEKFFPNPNEYLPERWLREDACPSAKKINNFVFLPFGFGPRMCAGKRIVDLELEMNIARLVRNFHIEFNYPTENAFVCKTMNVPNIPLKFKFEDIEH